MRLKRDYMGNDQLLPAYNLQTAICDEYIAVIDVIKPYASDMECFVPLVEKYMKFTMYKKETTDKKYSENPYRAVNFTKDADGNLICSNRQKFLFKRTQPVKYSKYGRTEELYECESCEGCPHKQECCPRAHKNRTIRVKPGVNRYPSGSSEQSYVHTWSSFKNESKHSIREDFWVLKWDKSYKRLFRRGEKNVILELTLISCGFNLYKYHNKKQRQMKVA